MNKILLFLLIPIIFYSCGLVNNENENINSEYDFLNADSILSMKDDVVVVFVSSGCPGKINFMPIVKHNLSYCNKNDIQLIIIANEHYDNKLDYNLNNLSEEYKIPKKDIWLMDPKKYGLNNAFSNKVRYENYLKELCNDCDDGGRGYAQYFIFKNGKLNKKGYQLDLEKEFEAINKKSS